MPDGSERDWAISTAQGQIHLKTWGGSGRRPIPIVLFNGLPDSVGPWGDFPLRLSRATGQMVAALDRPAVGRSDLPRALPRSETWERRALRQIGVHPGFESFIACGYDRGGPIAAEAAAWAGPACLGLITIRGRAWAPEPLSDFSIDDAVPKLRCPVLALHGELGEFGPIGHAGRGSAAGEIVGVVSRSRGTPHGASGDEMIAAIREFLALRVFPLPLH